MSTIIELETKELKDLLLNSLTRMARSMELYDALTISDRINIMNENMDRVNYIFEQFKKDLLEKEKNRKVA